MATFLLSDSEGSKKLFEADSALGSQGNMDELLSLCSGRFTGKNHNGSEIRSQIRNGTQYVGESQGDIDDLLLTTTGDSNNR